MPLSAATERFRVTPARDADNRVGTKRALSPVRREGRDVSVKPCDTIVDNHASAEHAAEGYLFAGARLRLCPASFAAHASRHGMRPVRPPSRGVPLICVCPHPAPMENMTRQ